MNVLCLCICLQPVNQEAAMERMEWNGIVFALDTTADRLSFLLDVHPHLIALGIVDEVQPDPGPVGQCIGGANCRACLRDKCGIPCMEKHMWCYTCCDGGCYQNFTKVQVHFPGATGVQRVGKLYYDNPSSDRIHVWVPRWAWEWVQARIQERGG